MDSVSTIDKIGNILCDIANMINIPPRSIHCIKLQLVKQEYYLFKTTEKIIVGINWSPEFEILNCDIEDKIKRVTDKYPKSHYEWIQSYELAGYVIEIPI